MLTSWAVSKRGTSLEHQEKLVKESRKKRANARDLCFVFLSEELGRKMGENCDWHHPPPSIACFFFFGCFATTKTGERC